MKSLSIKYIFCLGIYTLLGSTIFADTATLDTLKTQIDQQSKAIEQLKERLKETESKIETTADMVENSSASQSKTVIGGYGELHYNNLSGSGGASDKKEIDFHRFVLFFSHKYSDTIRLVSEFELEHALAGESKNGEVELEQAYIDFTLNQNINLKTGVFLLPIGIMNETHEPPTFYGVERNPVEKNILPTTWWEAGLGLSGRAGENFSYDFAITSGLLTTAAKSYAIRNGRQKVSIASAEDLAFTAGLKWMPKSNFTWALAFQSQSDVTQGSDTTAGSASLIESHIVWNISKFTLKALYASWSLSGSGPNATGSDEQSGFYFEPSYRLCENWGVFARYNAYDNKAGASGTSEKKQFDLGVNYWPHEDVVIKLDFQSQDNEDNKDQKGFNLGVGYQF
jgi:hypothetical protein